MIKPTKRKAFNFLRSYFDVFNELNNDEDKLNFLTSIINKQFLNEDPKGLNFIVNLCYESQRHAIESSVKGWIRVTKQEAPTNPSTYPSTNPPTNPETIMVLDPKEEEEKEEEKEEVITPLAIFTFDEFWSLYPNKVSKDKCLKKFKSLNDKELLKIKETIKTFISHKPFPEYNHPNPLTYLNQKRWDDEIKVNGQIVISDSGQLEEMVTYYTDQDYGRKTVTRTAYEKQKKAFEGGGWKFFEVETKVN